MHSLTFRQMSKAYDGLSALSDVTLTLTGGRVHALMGENGAGKSTLIKLIAGVVRADSLTVEKDGAPVPLASPGDAHAAGFRFIHQELNMVPQVSVAENVLLGRPLPRRFGVAVHWPRVRAMATQALAFLGASHIDVRALAGELSAGDRMLVKIAAALVADAGAEADLYVLDEPTAALTAEESRMLFAVIARLTARGAAVLYVSHRIDEVMAICDDVTVLRDGRHVLTEPVAGMTKDRLIHAMTGRDVKDAYPPRRQPVGAEVVAEVRGASGHLAGLEFTLRAGEILGVAGLAEAGQSRLLGLFMGLEPWRTGRAQVLGRALPKGPAEAWAMGIACLPKERRAEGLMLDLSIRANVLLPHLGAYGLRAMAGAERRDAAGMAARMRVKCETVDQPVGQLSGGNQQKVVFARALQGNPRLLLLDEPTRGVDVGAKFDIYSTVREVSAQGCAILMTSSDLPEMLGMCDRIIVLRNGVQAGIVEAEGLSSADLLALVQAEGMAA
jgi:ribose transport system ATP-binding protein